MDRLARIIAMLICAAAAACSGPGSKGSPDPDPVEYLPFDDRPVEEDPGTALVPGVNARAGFGSTSDGEIVFIAEAPGPDGTTLRELQAKRVADGERRTVSDWPIGWPIQFSASPDGEAVYYVATDPEAGVPALREAYSHGNVHLDAGSQPFSVQVSSDAGWIFVEEWWGGPPPHSKTLAIPRGTGTSVEFPCDVSPDIQSAPGGDEQLCTLRDGPTANTMIRTRLSDGAADVLEAPWQCSWSFAAYGWSPSGPLFACRLGPDLVVIDLLTGATVSSAPGNWDTRPASVNLVMPIAFSPDGSAVAYATRECLAGTRYADTLDVATCERSEWQLRIFDLVTGETRLIATSAGEVGKVEFSADRKTLTYLFGDTIYTRPTGL